MGIIKQKGDSSMSLVRTNTIKSVIMNDKVYIDAMCLPYQLYRTLMVFDGIPERKRLESPEPITLRRTTRTTGAK